MSSIQFIILVTITSFIVNIYLKTKAKLEAMRFYFKSILALVVASKAGAVNGVLVNLIKKIGSLDRTAKCLLKIYLHAFPSEFFLVS